MAPFQTSVKRYQDRFFEGDLVEDGAYVKRGLLHVPSAQTITTKSGMPVVWDATQNRFRLPTTAVEAQRLVGIIINLRDSIAKADLKNDSPIEVCMRGVVAVKAGGVSNFYDRLVWQTGDQKWDSATGPVIAAITGNTWNATARTAIKTSVDAGLITAVHTVVRYWDYADSTEDSIIPAAIGMTS